MASLGLSLLCCLIFWATSNGQPKTTRMLHRGDRVRIDPVGQVEFPSELDLEILIDGEVPVICTAGKLPGAFKTMSAVDSEKTPTPMSRNIDPVKAKDKAFYVDDNGSYEITSDSNEDGTVTTNVRGVVRPRQGRKCWMSHGQTRCWDVKMDGKYYEDVHLLDRPTRKPSSDAEHTSGARSKRAPSFEDYLPSKVVEIVYIVDKAMVDWFMLINDGNKSVAIEDMNSYIYLMNNEATFMYGSIKESVNLDIQLMAVVLLYPTVGTEWSWVIPHKIGGMLDCRYPTGAWRSYKTWAENGNLDQYQFDIAAVVSGSVLSVGRDPGLLGMALLGTVCDSDRSVGEKVVFNEDLYDDAMLTLAHELGHSLGALHDGDGNNCNPDKYLMAPGVLDLTSSNRKTYRTFSECSARQIKAHLDDNPDCMSDHNDTQYLENLCKGVRGNRFSVDFNCQKALRIENSKFCGPFTAVSQGKVPARACWDDNVISCTNVNGYCYSRLYNMFDGTPCEGENKNNSYVCYKGSCIAEYELCPTSPTSPPSPPSCTCENKKGRKKKRCCKASKNTDGTCCTGCRLNKRGTKCIK